MGGRRSTVVVALLAILVSLGSSSLAAPAITSAKRLLTGKSFKTGRCA